MSDCPKCSGSMSEGFVIDHGDYGATHVSTFQAGEPAKSFWSGTKQSPEDQFAILTMRCNRCGFLESYAR